MTSPSWGHGNDNALLALHFRECDPRTDAATRAHVATCARCGEYLDVLARVDRALLAWSDEAPPPGLADRVLTRATRNAQPAPKRLEPTALPLIGLLPAMAAVLAVARMVAMHLTTWPYWEQIEHWPGVQALGGFGVAALLLLGLGGLGSLALAPALLLESQRNGRPAMS